MIKYSCGQQLLAWQTLWLASHQEGGHHQLHKGRHELGPALEFQEACALYLTTIRISHTSWELWPWEINNTWCFCPGRFEFSPNQHSLWGVEDGQVRWVHLCREGGFTGQANNIIGSVSQHKSLAVLWTSAEKSDHRESVPSSNSWLTIAMFVHRHTIKRICSYSPLSE